MVQGKEYAVLESGTLRASGENVVSKEELEELMLDAVMEVFDKYDFSNSIYTEDEIFDIASEYASTFLKTKEEIFSIVQFCQLRKNRFDRFKFVDEHPELALKLNEFCHLIRAKVSLAVHTEKEAELLDFLKEKDVQRFFPNMLTQGGNLKLEHWFTKNVRNKDGKPDWKLLYDRVKEDHPCEYAVRNRPDDFEVDTAIELMKEVADEFINEKGEWQPVGDTGAIIKGAVEFLRVQPEFRRQAKRPDLKRKGQKGLGESRPNWYAVARKMGKKYFDTLKIAYGQEIAFRDFEDAVDEVQDWAKGRDYEKWSLGLMEKELRPVYRWIVTHCRAKEIGKKFEISIDLEKFLGALDEDTRKCFVRRGM